MSAESDVKRRQMSEDQAEKKDSAGPRRGPLLPDAIANMPSRWKTWWIRGIFTFVMIGIFAVLIYLGPICLTVLIVSVLLKCFQEITSIGYSKYKEFNIPLYRVLSWYFIFTANYFLVGDNLFYYYPEYFKSNGLLSVISAYHHIISFAVYIGGFIMFVLTLKKDHYNTQFGMFGWTHITIFMLGAQAYLIIQNLFEGLFWFLVPVSLVICNDIFAYLFGFFFGRTPLIKLSPKKTWEGFIGGFVSTVIFGFVFAYFLSKFDYFICYKAQPPCERPLIFTLQEYSLGGLTVNLYPAQLHSFPLSIFASLIAPFGGFFASGFKRAFNVKDFADVIPGHGGLMDRFDCQILMSTFANIYYFTFCRSVNAEGLLTMLLALPIAQQQEILQKLRERTIVGGGGDQ